MPFRDRIASGFRSLGSSLGRTFREAVKPISFSKAFVGESIQKGRERTIRQQKKIRTKTIEINKSPKIEKISKLLRETQPSFIKPGFSIPERAVGPAASVLGPLEVGAAAAIRKEDKPFGQKLKEEFQRGGDIGGALETRGVPSGLATGIGLAAAVALPGAGEVAQIKKLKGLTSVEKLTDAVKKAKPAREALEEAFTKERARRIGRAREAFQEGGESGARKGLRQLKGELAKQPDFEPIRSNLAQNEIDELFTKVTTAKGLDDFEKVSAVDGLNRLLDGRLPQANQIIKLEDALGREFAEAVLKKADPGFSLKKLREIAVGVLNIPKALKSSLDASGTLRQAAILTVTSPRQAVQSLGKSLRFAVDEGAYKKFFDELEADELFPKMKQSGLFVANPNKITKGLQGREEAFMTDFAQKIPLFGPLVKASERLYTGYLNLMRAGIFREMAETFAREGTQPVTSKVFGKIDPFKSAAEMINTFTGRGQLGRLEKVAGELNSTFWSPRFVVSRINAVNPKWYLEQHPVVRKEAAKRLVSFWAVGMSILGLAKLAGAKVEDDPNSSDWGKIRVGKTRWDIWAGYQQFMRFVNQIVTGEVKSPTTGRTREASRLDVTGRFVRGKLAPVPTLAVNMFDGKNLIGEEVKINKELLELVTPLYLSDISESIKDLGPSGILSVGVPAFFGIGTQTFGPRTVGSPSRGPTKTRSGTTKFR